MSYQQGTQIRASLAIAVAGVATDPTALSLVVRSADGTETTYTYAGTTITKDSAGNYHRDLTLDAGGTWHYSWRGTGTALGRAFGTWDVTTDPLG